jgi:hypothetical protein
VIGRNDFHSRVFYDVVGSSRYLNRDSQIYWNLFQCIKPESARSPWTTPPVKCLVEHDFFFLSTWNVNFYQVLIACAFWIVCIEILFFLNFYLFIYLFYHFYIYSHVYLFLGPPPPGITYPTLLFSNFVEEKTRDNKKDSIFASLR